METQLHPVATPAFHHQSKVVFCFSNQKNRGLMTHPSSTSCLILMTRRIIRMMRTRRMRMRMMKGFWTLLKVLKNIKAMSSSSRVTKTIAPIGAGMRPRACVNISYDHGSPFFAVKGRTVEMGRHFSHHKRFFEVILLMEEIPNNHLGFIKPCK